MDHQEHPTSTRSAVSPLRQRMIENVTIRRFGEHTKCDYVRQVAEFTVFLDRACRTAASAARLDTRVSMHALQHSFDTHLLERKTDIHVIQVLLGHRKLDTMAVYTRVALKSLREVESPLSLLTSLPL